MSDDSLVQIPQGALRGSKLRSILGDSYHAFQRIPFAKPPVGELRFKAPEPAEGWSDVLDCQHEGGVPPSIDEFAHKYDPRSNEDCLHVNVYTKKEGVPPANDYFTKEYDPRSSEDCLHLNVYTKRRDGGKLPVMVFIYGGGFTCGTGNKSEYGPDLFMMHDVVLVTFNYRVGALGFLSLQNSICPGNFGLKDQRLALQWVQQNISYFNGDPGNVTVFGESAGGASTHYQFLSDSTKGLFHRVIVQSAAAINRWAYSNKPRDTAYLLGKKLGWEGGEDEELLEFLRTVSVEDIVAQSEGLTKEVEGELPGEENCSFPFTPTAEPPSAEAILTKHPMDILEAREYQDVPYMTGICTKEMLFAMRDLTSHPSWSTAGEMQDLLPRDLGLPRDSTDSLAAAARLQKFYFPEGVNFNGFVDALSATFFNHGIYRTVMHHVTNPKRTAKDYLYVFSYNGRRGWVKNLLNLPDAPGTIHGDELGYQFHVPNCPLVEPESPEQAVARHMTGLWVSFATTGVPTPDDTWQPTSADSLGYLDIGEELVFKEGFYRSEMTMWDEVYNLKN